MSFPRNISYNRDLCANGLLGKWRKYQQGSRKVSQGREGSQWSLHYQANHHRGKSLILLGSPVSLCKLCFRIVFIPRDKTWDIHAAILVTGWGLVPPAARESKETWMLVVLSWAGLHWSGKAQGDMRTWIRVFTSALGTSYPVFRDTFPYMQNMGGTG